MTGVPADPGRGSMFRRLAGISVLRLFSTAVIDQALLSLANFGVGLLLIRYSPAFEYGYYVLAYSVLQLLLTAHGCWVVGPLSVIASKRSEEQRREMVGAIERSQGRVVRLAAGLLFPVPLALAALGPVSIQHALIASAIVITGWLMVRREFMRGVLMIYSLPKEVLRLDALYASVLVSLAAVATLSPAASACAVLGMGVAAALGARKGRGAFAKRVGWTDAAPAAPVWADLRRLGTWTLAGGVIYWVYFQAYNFILAARMDLEAVAEVNAARLMLMPMVLLAVGVGSLLHPKAAGWLHRDGLPVVLRRLWQFFAGMLVLDLLYIAFVWFAHDWIADVIMKKEIGQLSLLVMLWAGQMTLSMARDVFLAGALALECHRQMAWITALAAIVSLASVWVLVGRFGTPGAVLGTIAGEFASLICVAGLLVRHSRLPLPPRPDAANAPDALLRPTPPGAE